MAAATEFEVDLGIEAIDIEHRDLVRLFSAFAQAISSGAPVDEAHAIVKEALAAANAHFEHEEQLAEDSGYTAIDEHKLRHRHMRMQMAALAGDALSVKAQDPVTLERLFEIRRLLEEHIDGPDRELAAFLKEAGYR